MVHSMVVSAGHSREGARSTMRDLLKRLMSGLRGQSVTDTAAERGAADRAGASEASAAAEQERIPPDAARVAARALVLAAVTARGNIERDTDKGQASENHHWLCRWFDAVGVAREAEPDEDALIRAPVGCLEQQDIIDAMWRGEAIVVLAWSLTCAGLPRYDETCDSQYACVSAPGRRSRGRRCGRLRISRTGPTPISRSIGDCGSIRSHATAFRLRTKWHGPNGPR
jgi:hypothetical protein